MHRSSSSLDAQPLRTVCLLDIENRFSQSPADNSSRQGMAGPPSGLVAPSIGRSSFLPPSAPAECLLGSGAQGFDCKRKKRDAGATGGTTRADELEIEGRWRSDSNSAFFCGGGGGGRKSCTTGGPQVQCPLSSPPDVYLSISCVNKPTGCYLKDRSSNAPAGQRVRQGHFTNEDTLKVGNSLNRGWGISHKTSRTLHQIMSCANTSNRMYNRLKSPATASLLIGNRFVHSSFTLLPSNRLPTKGRVALWQELTRVCPRPRFIRFVTKAHLGAKAIVDCCVQMD